jgi:hypothetical protein
MSDLSLELWDYQKGPHSLLLLGLDDVSKDVVTNIKDGLARSSEEPPA